MKQAKMKSGSSWDDRSPNAAETTERGGPKTYWFLDIQTTGSQSGSEAITEMGWCGPLTAEELVSFGGVDSPPPSIRSSFVGLPKTFSWNEAGRRRWEEWTGLSSLVLEDAPCLSDVWDKVIHSLQEGCCEPSQCDDFLMRGNLPVCVVHYAAFERRFLGQLVPSGDFPFAILCTHRLARETWPDLPSKSLRAVAGALGHQTGPLKRAGAHVTATVRVAAVLLGGTEHADDGSAEAPHVPAARRVKAVAATERLALPDAPGVYRFVGPSGVTLYVGKATSLRRRVNSYFRGRTSKGQRLQEMISQVGHVGTILVSNEMEAVLIESLLIKDLDPPYNRAQRSLRRRLIDGVVPGGPLVGGQQLERVLQWFKHCLDQGNRAAEVGPISAAWEVFCSDAHFALGNSSKQHIRHEMISKTRLMTYARILVREKRLQRESSQTEDEAEVVEEDVAPIASAKDPETVGQWLRAFRIGIRILLLESLRARRIHRMWDAEISIESSEQKRSIVALRQALPVLENFSMVTEDPVLKEWVVSHAATLGVNAQTECDQESDGRWDLKKWDCCAAALAEITRLRNKGVAITVLSHRSQ